MRVNPGATEGLTHRLPGQEEKPKYGQRPAKWPLHGLVAQPMTNVLPKGTVQAQAAQAKQ